MSAKQRFTIWGGFFFALFGIFCVAYPIAVIGVAFDVHPPFSLAWAGSVLLLLEGILLIVAAVLCYGWLRGLCAGLIVLTLSYLVEALGVGTGFPFGVYRYTGVLFPKLPGAVPMAVMFAWVLIVFGVYGWVHSEKRRIGITDALLGATLATLLDLEVEPVAAHLEHYWQWLAPGRINYYGVPLTNFAAWFVVTFVLLLLVDTVLFHRYIPTMSSSKLIVLLPRLLFGTSLFMFGLVDVTHGYYGGAFLGILAGLIIGVLSFMERKKLHEHT
ncbi:MAG: carotenoid biosynthesis protein [Ktedonobacteraceae bacterium]